jgi:hypothetical protein
MVAQFSAPLEEIIRELLNKEEYDWISWYVYENNFGKG